MKINKRLLSFFLAVLMVFSTFGETVYALSSSNETGNRSVATELEGKVEGDKEVFTFDLSEFKSKESVAPMTTKAMPARAPRRAPAQWDTEVNIETTGLNGKAFDWTALPNKEFKLIAKWETTDGQKHQKEIATITDTSDAKQFVNVGWPVDGTMKGNASVVTNYNGNIEVRVAIISGSGTGGSGRLTFDIKLTELAEPRVNIEYVDPYGRPITDPEDLPAETDTMPKVTAEELTDVAIELPKAKGQINMRNSGDIDDDELNTAEAGLTYKVDGKEDSEKITIGGKEYIVDISQPNAKEIGTIKMVYQKDVVIPPTKDDGTGEPVDPAEGYVRLTFDANENKVDGITGTHTAGDYKGKQKSYIDVKQGVNYDNANLQAAIKALSTTGTKLVGTETKKYAQDAKKPWTPVVPTDTTPVTTATYNAQYAKSAAEQVTELGGLIPVTIKVWKGDKIDWADGVAPATTNSNDSKLVQGLLDNAKVTDQSSRSSNEAGKFEGKLLVKFEDKSTLEVANQWLYVWEHIVKADDPTDPNSPSVDDLPKDKIEVKFLASTGVESITTTGKTYAKEGTVFQDTDFPQEKDITFKDGYKEQVTWTPADKKVTTSSRAYDKRKGYFRFTATATKKKAAEEIQEAGGLKGVDLAAWVGDNLDANFWKKGAALADNVQDADGKLAALLAGATVTDKTNRTADAKGTFPGTLTVTFADGSSLEVDQKLFVYNKKDEVPTDPTQPTPEDAVVVTYEKGDGVKELKGTGKTLVKSGETLEAGDFPEAVVDKANGYKEPATWTPEDKVVTEQNKTFTATATKNVPTTKNSEDYDPHYTDESGKPGETVEITTPTFTKKGEQGTVPAPTDGDKKTTFTKNDPTQTNVTVDPNTGAIKVVIPQDAPVGSTITIPVDVTYPDGSNETVRVTVTVTNPDDKTKDPTIDQPYEGDKKITGKGEPESKIVVDLPDGTQVDGEVDKNGNWTVDVPVDKPLKAGDTITAKQIDKFGKEKTATTIVIAKTQPEPIPTPDYNPWWPIWFGSTKTEAKPEPKLLERHEEYIAGYPDGTVRPDGKITRAEVAAIFARLTEKHTLAEFVARFTDVKSTDWFADSIMKLSGKDIITGYPDGTFKPNKSITRAEFATIVSKYIKNPKVANETFSDVPMNHWAKDAIAKVKAEGWISGYNDGTFRPDAPITRAEAVSIVNRMFDRAADGEFVREHRFEIKSFKDLVENHWAYYEIMEAVHTHDYERIGTRVERWEKIVK